MASRYTARRSCSDLRSLRLAQWKDARRRTQDHAPPSRFHAIGLDATSRLQVIAASEVLSKRALVVAILFADIFAEVRLGVTIGFRSPDAVPFTNPPAPQPGPVRARRTWNSSPSHGVAHRAPKIQFMANRRDAKLSMDGLTRACRCGASQWQAGLPNRYPWKSHSRFFLRGVSSRRNTKPTIDAIVLVDSSHDDDTQAIQSAIDEVAKRNQMSRGSRCRASSPRQAQGSRNSTHPCQRHRLAGLRCKDSGTTLLATGLDRRSLIEVVGGRMKPSGIRSPWPIAIFHPTP